MPDSNTAAAAGFQNPEAYEKAMGPWSRRLAILARMHGSAWRGDCAKLLLALGDTFDTP